MYRLRVSGLTLKDLVRRPGRDHEREEAGDPEQGWANANDELLHVRTFQQFG